MTSIENPSTQTDTYRQRHTTHWLTRGPSSPPWWTKQMPSVMRPAGASEPWHVMFVHRANGYSLQDINKTCKHRSAKKNTRKTNHRTFLPYIQVTNDRYCRNMTFTQYSNLSMKWLLNSVPSKTDNFQRKNQVFTRSCGKVYIGQNGRHISTRITEHIRDTRQGEPEISSSWTFYSRGLKHTAHLCGPCTDLVLILECGLPQCWTICVIFLLQDFFCHGPKRLKKVCYHSSRLSIAVILLSGNTNDSVSQTRCSVGGNCCQGVGHFPGFSSWSTIHLSGP
jgi:hypothetical protein